MIWWSTGAFCWGFSQRIRSAARSPAKKQWCCTTKKMGCEGSSPPSVDPGVGMIWRHIQATDSEGFGKPAFIWMDLELFWKKHSSPSFFSAPRVAMAINLSKAFKSKGGVQKKLTYRQTCVKMMDVSACHVPELYTAYFLLGEWLLGLASRTWWRGGRNCQPSIWLQCWFPSQSNRLVSRKEIMVWLDSTGWPSE